MDTAQHTTQREILTEGGDPPRTGIYLDKMPVEYVSYPRQLVQTPSDSPRSHAVLVILPDQIGTPAQDVTKVDVGWKRNEEGEKRCNTPPHPPGVIDTVTSKKFQMKRSRTAPSSRRRPQIEGLSNHASAEWNRTTAIALKEVYAGLPRLCQIYNVYQTRCRGARAKEEEQETEK
jgi:hypothetical protein